MAAIESLYERRYAYFVRVAQAVVGDRERAREAVQDAFANLIRSRASFRGDGPLEAWAWRSVVNAARKAVEPALVDLAVEEVGSVELPPFFGEVAPLVAALPERQRLIVFLRYYADLDYHAIADALGVEVGTIGSTLASAHRALRRALEEVETGG